MPFGGVVVKDLYNAGMAQPGHDLCLAFKTRLQVWVSLYIVMHDFDRDGAVQGEMRAEINLCHATLGNDSLDAYFTDCFTDPIGHERIIQREFNALSFETL